MTDELILAFLPVDAFHLVVGLPILLGSMWLAWRGQLIGLLCWPGVLLWVLYSYITNLVGVPFGVLFLPYLLLVTLSAYTTIILVATIDGDAVRRRLFELQSGMVWPDGSWAFSKPLGDEATRLLASIACILAALGLVAGGIAILVGQSWWRPVVVGAAAFSAAIFILLWDGGLQKLNDKGAIAILINLAILVAVLLLRWTDFGF
jgi:hypothetical protein